MVGSPDGGINPPISDSSTFYFDDADDIHDFVEGKVEDKFIAERLEAIGIRVFYPGLPSHQHHEKLTKMRRR